MLSGAGLQELMNEGKPSILNFTGPSKHLCWFSNWWTKTTTTSNHCGRQIKQPVKERTTWKKIGFLQGSKSLCPLAFIDLNEHNRMLSFELTAWFLLIDGNSIIFKAILTDTYLVSSWINMHIKIAAIGFFFLFVWSLLVVPVDAVTVDINVPGRTQHQLEEVSWAKPGTERDPHFWDKETTTWKR